ncbi:MAG: hypothetical protein JNJ46_15830 [Myxococcales bacterium]|nr:hypothetical protein [Myxococcales bacterium]
MRRNIFLTSLTTALLAVPLLAGCGNNSTGTKVIVGPDGLEFEDCSDGQLIGVSMVNGARKTSCTQALTSGLAPPDCSTSPNLVLNAYDGKLECMPKATGGANTTVTNVINKVVSDTNTIEQTINSIKGGGAAAKYCGQYSAAQNPNGAISGNGVTGVAGAANLCAQVAGCGSGAHMCTVYEMYESVAAGHVTAAMNISQSWVHMSSWQHNGRAGQATPNNGLADNCGEWTYPTGDLQWFGTTVEWKAAQTGPKALHFASGPGVVGCAQRFPIACCL